MASLKYITVRKYTPIEPAYYSSHKKQFYTKFKEYCPRNNSIDRTTIGIPNAISCVGYQYIFRKGNRCIFHRIGNAAFVSIDYNHVWKKYNIWGFGVTHYEWVDNVALDLFEDNNVAEMMMISFKYAFPRTVYKE